MSDSACTSNDPLLSPSRLVGKGKEQEEEYDSNIEIERTPRTSNESDRIILNIVDFVDNDGNFNINKNTEFCSELNDGSSFKSMIEFILASTSNSTIDLYVTEDGMQFIGKDKIVGPQIIVKTDLRKDDMLSHSYISDKTLYYTQLDLTIKQCISCVAKKNGLKIYKNADEDYIYLEITSGTSSSTNIGIIKPPDVFKIIKPIIPEYGDENDPTCKIPTSIFSARCNDASKGSHKTVTFTSYSSGCIDIATGLVNDGVGTTGRFASFSEKAEDDEVISKVIIDKRILKSLSKITSMAPNGIIKIYMDPEMPLKILGNIGHYGQIRVYLGMM